MRKKTILIFMFFFSSIINSQVRTCVHTIATNKWGTGVIKRCCCGCQLMYMVGYSGTGTCGNGTSGGGSGGGTGGGGTPSPKHQETNSNGLIKNK